MVVSARRSLSDISCRLVSHRRSSSVVAHRHPSSPVVASRRPAVGPSLARLSVRLSVSAAVVIFVTCHYCCHCWRVSTFIVLAFDYGGCLVLSLLLFLLGTRPALRHNFASLLSMEVIFFFPYNPQPPPYGMGHPDKPLRPSHPRGLDFGPFRLRLAPFGSVWLRLAPFRVCFGSVSGLFRGCWVGWSQKRTSLFYSVCKDEYLARDLGHLFAQCL